MIHTDAPLCVASMEPEPTPQAERERQPVKGAAPIVVTDLASKTLAVKEGDTFLYSDLEGNLDHGGDYGLGLYSRTPASCRTFRMTISARDPVLLSSSSERGYMAYVDLTNPNLYEGRRSPSRSSRSTSAASGRSTAACSSGAREELQRARGLARPRVLLRRRLRRHLRGRGMARDGEGTSRTLGSATMEDDRVRLHRSRRHHRVTRIAFASEPDRRRRRRRGRHGHLPASPRSLSDEADRHDGRARSSATTSLRRWSSTSPSTSFRRSYEDWERSRRIW